MRQKSASRLPPRKPSLDKYLQEIGKVDCFTPDEEVTLAQRSDGDQQALEKADR
jgi:hypothetical protein